MPAAPVPVPDAHADSVAAAQAAQLAAHQRDSALQSIVRPHYRGGFDGIPVNDSTDVSGTLQGRAVMEHPATTAATPRQHSLLSTTTATGLWLGAALMVALSYRGGYKYIRNLKHNMVSVRRRENMFEDHTVNETRILGALIANTCVNEGLLLYSALDYYTQLGSLLHGIHSALAVLLLVAVAVVFYLGQLLAYKVVGYVFTDRVNSKLWLDGFKASQSLLGLLLLPVTALALLNPAHASVWLWLAAGLYVAARVVFICKGFRIFYEKLPSIVYFILYLCAVEIVPISIVVVCTIKLCEHLLS